MNNEYYSDYYESGILRFRFIQHNFTNEEFVQFFMYYDKYGKLVFVEVGHYRGSEYSLYFKDNNVLYTEIGSFSYESDYALKGDIDDIKSVVAKHQEYLFIIEDVEMCLQYAYK